MKKTTQHGAKIYTPLTLKLYDWWVLGVSNRFAWQCSTSEVLVPHFKSHAGKRHLDIGAGTGFYLQHLSHDSDVWVMDMNANSLAAAQQRVRHTHHITTIKHDIYDPLPQQCAGQFDSVSLYYLLHCLPGTMTEKAIAIRNAASALNTKGVLFGATILGDDANHNMFGKKLMSFYNAKRIFSNRNDNEPALRHVLTALFEEVEIFCIGKVALFSARSRR